MKKKIENLNKDNFWNDLHKKYPILIDDFCNWIDEWKRINNWFGLYLYPSDRNEEEITEDFIKFHDYPYAVQLGIWLEYLDDRKWNDPQDRKYMKYLALTDGLRVGISMYFAKKHDETDH